MLKIDKEKKYKILKNVLETFDNNCRSKWKEMQVQNEKTETGRDDRNTLPTESSDVISRCEICRSLDDKL